MAGNRTRLPIIGRFETDQAQSPFLSLVEKNGQAQIGGIDSAGYLFGTLAAGGSSGTLLKSGDYVVDATADNGFLISVSATATITLPAVAPTTKWFVQVQNTGSGIVTVNPNGLNIDGSASSISLSANQGLFISTDGTGYYTQRGVGGSGASGFAGVSVKVNDYVALSADVAKLLSFNKATPVQLTLPGTAPSSTWFIYVQNTGAGDLTIARNGKTIDGAASNITLHQNDGCFVFCDGSNYFTDRGIAATSSGTGTGFTSVLSKTNDYTALSNDAGKVISFNKSSAVALTLPATAPGSSWCISVQNVGAGDLTVNPNGLTLDGSSASVVVKQTQGMLIYSDGSNYFSERGWQAASTNPTPASYLGWRNVMDYGAVGDGVTDDSAAIQAAIDAAIANTSSGGGRVYFPRPSVNYYIASTLNIDPNTVSQLYMYGDAGPRDGGISQFARAPRTRIEGPALPLIACQNESAKAQSTDLAHLFNVSQVTVSGGTTTYTGTISGGAANAYAGLSFKFVGFVNPGNNLTAVVTASTATTLVVSTTTQVNETGFSGGSGDIYITFENLEFISTAGLSVWMRSVPFFLLNNCGIGLTVYDPTVTHSTGLCLDGSTLWFKARDCNFTMDAANTGPFRPSLTVTSVSTSSAGNAVYHGTFPNYGSDGYIGEQFLVAGFTNGVNNGTFVCVAATATTLALANASASAETHAATATSTQAYDPASWAPPSILIIANADHDGDVLFVFDFCTFAHGGLKIRAENPGSAGFTLGNYYFNTCAVEGQFASPLIWFTNAKTDGGGATLAKVTVIESQMADVAHPTPLIAAQGLSVSNNANVGSIFATHPQSHETALMQGIAGRESFAGIFTLSPSTYQALWNQNSAILAGSGLIRQTNEGFDFIGPIVGPANAYDITTADGGAVRCAISDPATTTASFMLDLNGDQYFGPGGSSAFDLLSGRSGVAASSLSSPVATPTNFVVSPAAGGSFPDGTYYLKIAAGDRNNSPFTVSAASGEQSVVLGGGNNTISCTWTPSPTNPNTKYTIYIGTTPGGENKATNVNSAGGPVSIATMPASNQTPNTVGTLLAPFFTVSPSTLRHYFGTTDYMQFAGTPTANRTITIPDASGTLSLLEAANSFSAQQNFGANIKVGVSGTALSQIAVFTATLTPSSVAANTSAEEEYTVTGVAVTDKVFLGNYPAPTAGTIVGGVRVSNTNKIKINWGNLTGSPATPAAGDYTFVAIRS